MPDPLVLAIDNGTQSVRAMLVDPRGAIVAKSRVPLRPLTAERPGWAEEDPAYFWSCLSEACLRLWQMDGVRKEEVAGVALTAQRATVVNVDRDGDPLRPAITWLDHRRTEGLGRMGGPWGWLFRAAGVSGTVAYLMAEAEANWIRVHQPDIWDRTYRYLFLTGFLSHRLTGRFVDSTGCQVGYVPFDYKRLRWAGARDWKWRAVPVQPSMLPDLLPPGSIMGEITATASEATGIPEGLPVVAAAADKACEVLGAGCLASDVACLGYGTTATINVISPKYVEAVPLLPPYPAAIPGVYNTEVEIYRGYWMVSWFKREFGHYERHAAKERGVRPEDLFDELVRAVPPGAEGLMLQPYWSPGLKIPGPEARGAIIGFSAGHTRAHVYRAILEGLAYALREGKERIERRSGTRLTELRVCGGGSQSDGAMQLTADIFGLPATRPHVFEASGLGAAVDAAVGLGLYPDFRAAVAAMAHPGRTFEPDPDTREIYDGLYNRVYKRMYRQLKPLYESIREIAGEKGAARPVNSDRVIK